MHYIFDKISDRIAYLKELLNCKNADANAVQTAKNEIAFLHDILRYAKSVKQKYEK